MANTRELVSVVHFPPNVNIYRHNNVQKTADVCGSHGRRCRILENTSAKEIQFGKKEGLTRDRVRRAESSGQTRLNTVIEIP